MSMSLNVRAAMQDWQPPNPMPASWAIGKAEEIVGQTVPQVSLMDNATMLYALPAGLKFRLTIEIAAALEKVAKERS